MAAPNIVNVSTITGITTALSLTTTSATTIVSNAASSNKVFKINTVTAANIDGTALGDVTVKYHTAAAGAGTSIAITSTVGIPADSTLIVIGKDNPIYLEENRSLTATSGNANRVAIVCSYEEIS